MHQNTSEFGSMFFYLSCAELQSVRGKQQQEAFSQLVMSEDYKSQEISKLLLRGGGRGDITSVSITEM